MMRLFWVESTHNILEIEELIVILGDSDDGIDNRLLWECVGRHMNINRFRKWQNRHNIILTIHYTVIN